MTLDTFNFTDNRNDSRKREKPVGSAKKGQGAWYGWKIERLGKTHRDALTVLRNQIKQVTSHHIAFEVNKLRKQRGETNMAFASVAGRLSEMLGMDPPLVEMDGKPELYDEEMQVYDWPVSPTWRITEAGRSRLELIEKNNDEQVTK